MTTFAECVTEAESVGFNPPAAGKACHILQSESGIGADQRCACARTEGGTIYHDAECDAMGLTKHCGVLQLDVTNPAFKPVLDSGCGYDVACSIRALFDLSKGGACFDQPNPWGPDTGHAYGGCLGTVSPATLSMSPGPGRGAGVSGLTKGEQDCTWDPSTWIDCNINIGGADPFGGLGGIGDVIGALSNPNTWLRLGIGLAGIVAIGMGLYALVARPEVIIPARGDLGG